MKTISTIILISILKFSILGQATSNYSYSYDPKERLVETIFNNDITITYTYDEVDNLIETNIDAPCDHEIWSTANIGAGTLRNAIACAEPGDTLTFSSALIDETVLIGTPKILVDKELNFIADPVWDVTIQNEHISNTEVLIEISDDLQINGLDLIGKSASSFIWKIKPGGHLLFKNGRKINIDIQKE